jgi:tetratricopeptide (TPR) repeat protein
MSHQRIAIHVVLLAGIGLLALSISTPARAADDPEPHRVILSVAPFDLEAATSQHPLEAWVGDFAAALDFHRLDRFVASGEAGWLFAGLGIALLSIGIAFLVRSRPPNGVATFSIVFPSNVDGIFRVSLRRQSARSSGSRTTARRDARMRPGSRLTRSGVQRETQFEGLAPGLWIAVVEGTLAAPRSGAEIGRVSQETEFEVFSDSLTPVEVVWPTMNVPVELRVHWDRQPASDVGVCLRGRPESLRYSGQGVSRLSLDVGTHEVLIGGGDRVVSRTLHVEDYEPMLVDVDLATSEGVVFKGCPLAVTSCLQGDLGGAARALERDGQSDVASLLLAELHQGQGQVEHAATALENAGKPLEAAELRRSIHDYAGAATLYEEAGAGADAAEMYVAARSWANAARVYVGIEDWPRAAHAFEEAGDTPGKIGALEAQGEFLQAAGLAAEIDDRARAIRLLQQVAPQHPDYGHACELLVLAFEQEGHLDLAAHQLERRLEFMDSDESSPPLVFHLAELLEELGDDERALDVLEVLRDREPTYPKVATRIEGLRKKLSESLRQNGPAPFGSVPGATAFVTKARYEILDEVGSGGMGRVYRALDRRLGREVALKRMPESLRDHPTAVSLFLGEAQAAARMNHPNIVTLYDADQEQGHFFITMELLHGLPLNAVLKEHGPFDAIDTARLGLQACAGLAYAHAQGIVHRDIKTANLFITKEKALKIMDFGLAKMVEAVRDQNATLIAGTPLYMAPEQAAGNVVDGRTDLYGLGVTLFELSTGRLPFFEGDVAEQHRHAAPPDPTTLVAGYPPALAGLILRMLSKRPEDRPASATEVAGELSALLDAAMTEEVEA